MKLTGHMMVKNEENWIWFAIKSVLPYLDQLIIVDTGSTDKTVEIIRTIKSKKIKLLQEPIKSRHEITKLRQKMVNLTRTEWFVIVDGDEVWPAKSFQKLSKALDKAGSDIIGAVVRTRNCVGDLYHYQPEAAGEYRLAGRVGHLTIRAYRKTKDYSWEGEYPLEAYQNENEEKLNEQDERLVFVDTYYYHLTHLKRSNDIDSANVIDRLKKYKLEIGKRARKEDLPKVFFADRPAIVADPFVSYTLWEKILAYVVTPLKKLKRFNRHSRHSSESSNMRDSESIQKR